MEKMGEWEQRSLINELTQGRELARQLQLHLNLKLSRDPAASSSSSHETREFLVQQIQASYEKALSMLNVNTSSTPAADHPPAPSSVPAIRMPESPPSLSGSPKSDQDSDRDFKEQADHYFKDASKKRKSLPRWTQLVQVTPGTALEGPLDDGFSWRKYGQKDILGAKFPRGYYRCTHRNVQGCLATKQVQRSDDDPTIFEITYRGRHTCTLANHAPPSPSPIQPPATAEATQSLQNQLLLNFHSQRGLKVITQDLDPNNNVPDQQTYPPPSSSSPFPNIITTTTAYPSSNIKVEDNSNVVFSPAAANSGINNTTTTTATASATAAVVGNDLQSSASAHFMPPGTSNYFSMYPSRSNTEADQFGTTSASNSLTAVGNGSLGFPFGNADDPLDPNFTFDDHAFFP